MDVLVLIDKLDDLVHNAKAVPLTDQVRIDREEIYDILDQMRATIPEEIKQARWIVKERQEMLAEAKRECDRLLHEVVELVDVHENVHGRPVYSVGFSGVPGLPSGYSSRKRRATACGTRSSTLPPNDAISFTPLDETKLYWGLAMT